MIISIAFLLMYFSGVVDLLLSAYGIWNLGFKERNKLVQWAFKNSFTVFAAAALHLALVIVLALAFQKVGFNSGWYSAIPFACAANSIYFIGRNLLLMRKNKGK